MSIKATATKFNDCFIYGLFVYFARLILGKAAIRIRVHPDYFRKLRDAWHEGAFCCI